MRLSMRFVSEQQSCLMLQRSRHLFIRQQTAVINAIRVTRCAISTPAWAVIRRNDAELGKVMQTF
jgi:hypothetical protein